MSEPFRPATQADLAQIVAIYNDTVPGRMVTADLEPVSIASREAWFAEHQPDSHPLWVCERAGRVAAWLSFSAFHARPAYSRTAEIGLYVHADFRRAGLGRMLLDNAMAHAPRIGIDHLVGLVFAHNIPSLRLFEYAGFERWGHLPGVARLDGIERDLLILGRRTP